MTDQHIANGLRSAPNFRPLAGSTSSGRALKPGIVFRSEAVLDPAGKDEAALRSTNIALVCDLRGHGERAASPNRWWRERGIEILDLDLLATLPPGGSPSSKPGDRRRVSRTAQHHRAIFGY